MPVLEEYHPQDWLLILQALDECADELTYAGREPPRAERARYLADRLAAEQGLPRDAIQTQIDPTYNGPTDDRTP